MKNTGMFPNAQNSKLRVDTFGDKCGHEHTAKIADEKNNLASIAIHILTNDERLMQILTILSDCNSSSTSPSFSRRRPLCSSPSGCLHIPLCQCACTLHPCTVHTCVLHLSQTHQRNPVSSSCATKHIVCMSTWMRNVLRMPSNTLRCVETSVQSKTG